MRKSALLFILCSTVCLAVSSTAQTVNLYVPFTDFGLKSNVVRSATVTPLARTTVTDGSIRLPEAQTITAASWPAITNGGVTFSNKIAGFSYRFEFATLQNTYAITSNIGTNLSGTVNIADYTAISTNLFNGTYAYSMAQSDARFAPIGSGGSGGITNNQSGVTLSGTFSGNGAGLTNLSVLGVTNGGVLAGMLTNSTFSASGTNAVKGILTGMGVVTNGQSYGIQITNNGDDSVGYMQFQKSGTNIGISFDWFASDGVAPAQADLSAVGNEVQFNPHQLRILNDRDASISLGDGTASPIFFNGDSFIFDNSLGGQIFGNGAGLTNIQGSSIVGFNVPAYYRFTTNYSNTNAFPNSPFALTFPTNGTYLFHQELYAIGQNSTNYPAFYWVPTNSVAAGFYTYREQTQRQMDGGWNTSQIETAAYQNIPISTASSIGGAGIMLYARSYNGSSQQFWGTMDAMLVLTNAPVTLTLTIGSGGGGGTSTNRTTIYRNSWWSLTRIE